MLLELVQIRRMGEKKREENERFRKHLKIHAFADRRIRRIAEDVAERFDCTECGNCCRVATARLQARDVERLSKYLRIPESRFVREYTQQSDEEGLILKRDENGCVFLAGTTCSVYEARPHSCEGFPHTVRGEGSFVSRMWQFTDRACYCPIVYHTLEALKDAVGFRK